MRIGQSAVLTLDEQRGSGQRQQGAYAVQRHTGVKGLGRGDRLLIGGSIGGVAGINVLKGHLTYVRRHALIYSTKRRPPQLFPARRERTRRDAPESVLPQQPVNMFFMAAGGSLLKREAGHHDAEENS